MLSEINVSGNCQIKSNLRSIFHTSRVLCALAFVAGFASIAQAEGLSDPQFSDAKPSIGQGFEHCLEGHEASSGPQRFGLHQERTKAFQVTSYRVELCEICVGGHKNAKSGVLGHRATACGPVAPSTTVVSVVL